MIWFGKQGLEIDLTMGVNMFVLPGEAHYVWSGSQWLSYYLPFEDEILAMVNQSFNPYDTPITADMLDLVDLNKLTLRSYSGKILEKITQRNPAPSNSANTPVTEENEASTPVEDASTSGSEDENDAENNENNGSTSAEGAGNNEEQTNNSSPESGGSSAEGNVTIITDEKGNLYEINEETGDILSVTPAPGSNSEENSTGEENNTQE